MEKGRREGMRGKNYDERNARGTGVGGGSDEGDEEVKTMSSS